MKKIRIYGEYIVEDLNEALECFEETCFEMAKSGDGADQWFTVEELELTEEEKKENGIYHCDRCGTEYHEDDGHSCMEGRANL